MIKKKALGRGLSALLSDAAEHSEEIDPSLAALSRSAGNGALSEILTQEIEPNPYQPRQEFETGALSELAESIKVHGIIQPITVRRLADKQYQLISGERRFKAAQLAGLRGIPAYVRVADDQQMLEMALIENIQRENLNPIEIALSYRRLMHECNLKQEELGDRVGKNRATVANFLRLLKLPPDVQIALRDKKISMGHARAIINVEKADAQLYLLKKIIEEDLSVRKVEDLARQLSQTQEKKTPAAKPPAANDESNEIRQLQSKLSSRLGTKVSIRRDGSKGEIRIPFMSTEDLNRLLDILKV